jgi:hypothetical protein
LAFITKDVAPVAVKAASSGIWNVDEPLNKYMYICRRVRLTSFSAIVERPLGIAKCKIKSLEKLLAYPVTILSIFRK